MLSEFLKKTHGLRLAFWLLIIFLIFMAPFAGDEMYKHGWKMFPTLIIPALVPFMFFLIPLDITMCGIQKASVEPGNNETEYHEKRQYYGKAIWTDLILMLVLFLAWLPFVLSLT